MQQLKRNGIGIRVRQECLAASRLEPDFGIKWRGGLNSFSQLKNSRNREESEGQNGVRIQWVTSKFFLSKICVDSLWSRCFLFCASRTSREFLTVTRIDVALRSSNWANSVKNTANRSERSLLTEIHSSFAPGGWRNICSSCMQIEEDSIQSNSQTSLKYQKKLDFRKDNLSRGESWQGK